MARRILIVSVLIAATVILSSCSSESGSNGHSDESPSGTAGSAATIEEPRGNTSEAPAREDMAATSATSSTQAETIARTASQLEVALAGTNGTKFSGICVSGQQESRLDGRVPDSFTFAPSGGGLECSIEKEGNDASVLRVIVDAGDNGRSVQQTNADQSSINFSYADGGFSASSSSSSSSSGSNSSSSSRSSQNSR